MRPAVAAFAAQALPNLAGCRVVEVGSFNVNGSIRSTIEAKGADSAGLVLSVDTLEHVEDWRAVVSEMKLTCSPGGLILLAAAPIGFQRHDHPGDFWRVSAESLQAMFADCEELALNEALPAILVRKPVEFVLQSLSDIELPEAPAE